MLTFSWPSPHIFFILHNGETKNNLESEQRHYVEFSKAHNALKWRIFLLDMQAMLNVRNLDSGSV